MAIYNMQRAIANRGLDPTIGKITSNDMEHLPQTG